MAILIALAAAPAAAQDKRGFVWDDRPSIVFGEDINIDIKGRVQFDWRGFDPDVDEETFDVRTAPPRPEGRAHAGTSTGRSSARSIASATSRKTSRSGSSAQWKDVYLNWTTFEAFSVKGGRFKMPFGLEQNTSVSDLDFAYRTLGSIEDRAGPR